MPCPTARPACCSPPSISSGVDEPVAIQPGAIELTVTPCGPPSMASARIIPSIPALAALYGASPANETTGPVTDETCTTLPQPR